MKHFALVIVLLLVGALVFVLTVRSLREPAIRLSLVLDHHNRSYQRNETIELRFWASGFNEHGDRIRVGAKLDVFERHRHHMTRIDDLTILDVDGQAGSSVESKHCFALEDAGEFTAAVSFIDWIRPWWTWSSEPRSAYVYIDFRVIDVNATGG